MQTRKNSLGLFWVFFRQLKNTSLSHLYWCPVAQGVEAHQC